MKDEEYSSLSEYDKDPYIRLLNNVIRWGVKVLALLMLLIILWAIFDVVWVFVKRLRDPPFLVLKVPDILHLFGAILVVLIAIEIFLNITLYLREDVIHVRLVVATALMAIARKVIVFDYKELSPNYIYASGAVILSLGVTYWLLRKRDTQENLKEGASK
ncbi:MAG: phosphate-starvation-inducible PsiE family protein [Deltaproteobacteria bacterium]|nr:phosphate-starvation-inducible PsiE family protein [Deltaproteobacteria bacterium]